MTFGAYLEEAGVLTDERRSAIAERVKREINEATDQAERMPLPDPESAARFVYWEGH